MARSADAAVNGDVSQVFGFKTGHLVQEFGYDEDVDHDLREEIEDTIDADLEDEDSVELVDAVIVWWRKGDGDLVDGLVDAIASLAPGAPVWLLTPKAGTEGHVMAADIAEAADLAGLHAMTSVKVAPEWGGTRLASRK